MLRPLFHFSLYLSLMRRRRRETGMGATKIMVIRHAEKPGSYNGAQYEGVNTFGTIAGDDGAKHLVTLGWERAGALVTLFAPPRGRGLHRWQPRNSCLPLTRSPNMTTLSIAWGSTSSGFITICS
jgi:hypothetical protein